MKKKKRKKINVLNFKNFETSQVSYKSKNFDPSLIINKYLFIIFK